MCVHVRLRVGGWEVRREGGGEGGMYFRIHVFTV